MAFSFGSPSASAPTGGFSFGGSAHSSSTPSSSTPAFGSAIGAAAAPSTGFTLKVPDYDSTFPYEQIYDQVKALLRKVFDDESAAQELLELLAEDALVAPPLLKYSAPNQSLRQQLTQNPHVQLYDEQEAALTPVMLQHVLRVADDLQLDEAETLAIYAKVNQPNVAARLAHNIEQPIMAKNKFQISEDITLAARELYFYERSRCLETILLLLQHRIRAPEGHLLLKATDQLFQKNLINNLTKYIREISSRIQQMLHMYARSESTQVKTHLDFNLAQRQSAAECLFFAAYHVQLTPAELVELIDLVKHLSDDCPILDPLQDVPTPYENAPPTNDNSWIASGFSSALPPLKEKDHLTWQRELVDLVWKKGQPQLLRALATIVMATLCGMDARNTKFDRNTHMPNEFGDGNAILPPNSNSTANLAPIQSRLNREAVQTWARPDVLGVLMARYAMLLRSSPLALSSPRASTGWDIRKTWRESLEFPTELKSFSFLRFSLLPAVRTPMSKGPCQISEFFLTILSEFAADYLHLLSVSNDRPISRKKWEQDAEEDLRLRRAHQEEQLQFYAWSGDKQAEVETVPQSVDLMTRPDCMDDVMAFVVAVCSLGPEYALRFWEIDSEGDDPENDAESTCVLRPIRALLELERQLEDDESLRPCYTSFVAALALADGPGLPTNGAQTIHEMLSSDDGSGRITWESIADVLRWFVRELNPEYDKSALSSSAASWSSSDRSSTAYYYYSDITTSTSGTRHGDTKISGSPKQQNLGEDNTYILLSYLHLIINVANRSARARSTILKINLPIQGSNRNQIVGQDSMLMILYSLAVAPISPETRGAVFCTIASLLNTDDLSGDDKVLMEKNGSRAWELLENCQILPIFMFDQYTNLTEGELKSAPKLSFPPSSTSLVSNTAGKSWAPPDPNYAIVYEMEHVESARGHYPSTEGFLRLLTSLIKTGGFPSDLGKEWRPRTGCSPYIEYVCDLLLPRATGKFPGFQALPFRSQGDLARFCTLATEVLHTTLARYIIPLSSDEASGSADFPRLSGRVTSLTEQQILEVFAQNTFVAQSAVGMKKLSRDLVTFPSISDVDVYLGDFQQKPTSLPERVESNENYVSQSKTGITIAASSIPRSSDRSKNLTPTVPPLKSPGYEILVKVLSSSRDLLFDALVYLLTCTHEVDCGQGSDEMAMSLALFCATSPEIDFVKGSQRSRRTSSQLSFIRPLSPTSEDLSYMSAIYWREKVMIHTLRIFCESYCREDLLERISFGMSQSRIVPALRFQRKTLSAAGLKVIDVNLSKLSELLTSSEATDGLVTAIGQLVGYTSFYEENEQHIGALAVSLLIYIDKSMPPHRSIGTLFGNSLRSHSIIRLAFSNRIVSSAYRCGPFDFDLLNLLLERFLTDLREGRGQCLSFSQILLGVATNGFDDMKGDETHFGGVEAPTDCFEALLSLLGDTNFILSPQTRDLAAPCFEILFRLSSMTSLDSSSIQQAFCAAKRLRSIDFWRTTLLKIVDRLSKSNLRIHSSTLHSVAWLVKAVSAELRMLKGLVDVDSLSKTTKQLVAPLPHLYKQIFTLFFLPPYQCITPLIDMIPTEVASFRPLQTRLSDEAIRAAQYNVRGSVEVVHGYAMIDQDRLMDEMKRRQITFDEDELRCWAESWNDTVANDCAAAHISDSLKWLFDSTLYANNYASDTVDGYGLIAHLLGVIRTCFSNSPGSVISFTTATRNIAQSILIITRYLTRDLTAENGESKLDSLACCAFLARVVTLSGINKDLSFDAARKNECTCLLAGALHLLLSDLTDSFGHFSGSRNDFLEAAKVLSKIVISSSNGIIDNYSSRQISMARCCLMSLLEIFDDPYCTRMDSFLQSVLANEYALNSPKSPTEELFDLVEKLDESVCILVSKISHLCYGNEILLEAGLMKSLKQAAKNYIIQEDHLLSSHDDSTGYKRIKIIAMPCIIDHLELMRTLMSTTAETHSMNVSMEVLAVLSIYEPLIKRLLSDFPVDGDLLQSFISCLSQSRSLQQSCGAAHFSGILSTGKIGNKSTLSTVEKTIVDLSIHIAENPFPSNFLPPLPSRLQASEESIPGRVSIAEPDRRWWDHLDIQTTTATSFLWSRTQIPNDICEYASKGMEIISGGLTLLIASKNYEAADLRALCRGFSRCVDAFRAIEDQLSSPIVSDLANYGRIQSRLTKQLTDIITKFLFLLNGLVRQRRHDGLADESIHAASRKAVLVAIDHSRLDMQTSSIFGSDENNPEYMRELAQALRSRLLEEQSVRLTTEFHVHNE